MLIQESSEMYLETIYILSEKKSSVRSIDVAEYMGFSKPSVSRAVGLLKEGGFITVDKNGFLSLTEEGKARAMKVYERHEVLTNMFISLGVDEETASEDAVAYATEYMHLTEEEGMVWGMIRTAMASVSDLCVTPMQDLMNLGAEARMNFPGTQTDANWTWRAEEACMDPKLAQKLYDMTKLYGRLGKNNS